MSDLFIYFIPVFAEKSADQMLIVAENLYTLLERENLLARNCTQRSVILKAVFKLLDYDHPAVLLSLSQLILSVS